LQKIWSCIIIILIGFGIYSLYGYLRLETPPIEEKLDIGPAEPTTVASSPGVSQDEILIGSSLALVHLWPLEDMPVFWGPSIFMVQCA